MPQIYQFTFEKDDVKIKEQVAIKLEDIKIGESFTEAALRIAKNLAEKRQWKLLSIQDLGYSKK